MTAARAEGLSSEELLALVTGERWFAAKGREVESARVVGMHYADETVAVPLVEIRFREGTHETYVLALAFEDDHARDALEHPALARALLRRAGVQDAPVEDVRPIGVEQSNSSVVVDGRHVLKLYRRLEPGPNPELELLSALAAAGFEQAPRLVGAIDHPGPPLEAVLAVVTGFVPSHGGGWELTLEGLSSGDPDWLPSRTARLGEVTGAMHTALAAADGPHLSGEEPSAEAVGLLTASVDEEIDRIFHALPEELQPVAARADDVRDIVQLLGQIGPAGRFTRIHGDYHLGQVLWSTEQDWVVIDFEGEPARSLAERRRPSSPLRDVAGMLRSFAYAQDAALILHGVEAPDGWADRCRETFLAAYLESVDPALLPPSEDGARRLLELFELQKLVYELRYEAANRPDWVGIPIAGIERLLTAVP